METPVFISYFLALLDVFLSSPCNADNLVAISKYTRITRGALKTPIRKYTSILIVYLSMVCVA